MAKVEREIMETSTLREYTITFATISELYRRLSQGICTRIGQVYVHQVKELIEKAIAIRPSGDINRAVEYLHRAARLLGQVKMVEETYGPQFEKLQQWHDVVARGVEPESEADKCLERFVAAVGFFNDAIAQNDVDDVIKTFDTAVELLKVAAEARHRH